MHRIAPKENPTTNPKITFTLKQFRQELGFRVFAFERVAEDRTRADFAVSADLSLIRKYGILVQDLPLLCRNLLERRDLDATLDNTALSPALTLTEDEMRIHADGRAAARSAAARKPPRRPPPGANPGSAWRAPQGTFSQAAQTQDDAAAIKPIR